MSKQFSFVKVWLRPPGYWFQKSCCRKRLLLAAVVVVLFCDTATAQRDLKDIPIPDPKLEHQTFRVEDGFEVNLFAADPMIAKPIQMNFDPSGRLWIVSSEVYPHIKPGAARSDRVLVLEDVDHDGVSDKTHVFAEGLLIPTGIAPGDGGAYVANSTELLHFVDSDDDLKADSKRVVLSGFGTEDTHHILHTLRWGPDGYLYFNQSIYIHSHIETPWGVRRLNAGGIWQFRPETLELGVFMRGLVNSWGHHFDRFGQSFATDGAGGEGINYIIPGAYYFTAANAPRILHGLNPGSPKHCGLEIVETPMLPADWQGSAITNDFRGHRVCRFNLSEDRSGYVSREQKEVIWSDHVAFRPIDVKLGPDGAIYIADWYNPIIQHGEVDFRDPRRDHTHGRIWRVSWKEAPPRQAVDISTLKTNELFTLLSDKDNYRRQMAKQVLRERGESALPQLRQWQASIPVNADSEHLRLEALWCFQSLRSENSDLMQQLLNANDGRVRAAAVRFLSHWRNYVSEGVKSILPRLINDPHPRVRLEAVRAVSFSPNQQSERDNQPPASAIELVMQAVDHPTDRFLDYAVWLTVREMASTWLPAFKTGGIDFDSNVQHLLTAFSAVGEGAPLDFLLTKLYLNTTTPAQRDQVIRLICTTGDRTQIGQLVLSAIENSDHNAIRLALTESLRRKLKADISEETIARLRGSENAEFRTAGLIATGQWLGASGMDDLRRIANSQGATNGDRFAAAQGIALIGGGKSHRVLEDLATSNSHPVSLRKHAVKLLIDNNPDKGAVLTARLLAELKRDDHPEDLTRSFMLVRNGDRLLSRSLNDVKLDTEVAREVLRIIRESGQPAAELESVVKAAGNITSRKKISSEERMSLLKMAREDVTAAEGERVFRNEKLGCLKCHAVGGAGGKVGPDMVSLGGSAQPDYLLESLLDPNAKVKENYHTVVVVTASGKVQSGVQVKQSKQEVVLRNAEDKLVTIPRADIDEIAQGVSLMPEGQVDTLTDREIASLVRFLSELGRTPEYTISRRQLARSWEVMQATDAAAFRIRRTSYAMATTDDPAFSWAKKYSVVKGFLPVDELPVVSVKNRSAAGRRGVGFARCTINAETAGDVMLKVNALDGLKLRVNEDPVDLLEATRIKLTAGAHRLTFTVDQTQRTQPLEVEILQKGTTAVVRFEN